MKRFAPVAVALTVLALAGCTDTSDLSAESSRSPAGNPNAAVIVTEYADLQCPACGSAHLNVTTPLIEKYGNDIAFEFKHFPIRTIHPYALEAAMGSECAADQGKFWEYLDTNYENQRSLNVEQIQGRAAELGLDEDLYLRCLKSQIKRDTILADYDEGKEAGVRGTPTYYVNGQQTPATVEALSAAIDAELAKFANRL